MTTTTNSLPTAMPAPTPEHGRATPRSGSDTGWSGRSVIPA